MSYVISLDLPPHIRVAIEDRLRPLLPICSQIAREPGLRINIEGLGKSRYRATLAIERYDTLGVYNPYMYHILDVYGSFYTNVVAAATIMALVFDLPFAISNADAFGRVRHMEGWTDEQQKRLDTAIAAMKAEYA